MILPVASILKFHQIFNCLNSIIDNSVDSSATVVHVGGNSEKMILDFPVIHRDYKGSKDPPVHLPRSSYFYLVNSDEIPIKRFMEISKKELFFNARAKFLMVAENFETTDVETLIFYHILNVIFLNTSTGFMYTYFPYEFGNLQNTSKDLRKIGLCDFSGYVLIDGHDTLYPEKIPKFWKNSSISLFYRYEPPMTISTEERKKGIEIELFNVILDRINITGNFVLKNVTGSTELDLLMNHTCDVFFGNEALLSPSPMDVTVPYLSDSAYSYVPQQTLIPKWKYALRAFSLEVWLFWLLSAIFSSIFWYTVCIAMENKTHPKQFIEKLSIIFKLFLEQSIKFEPKYISQLISIFLVIQSTFILNTVYKSKYIYFISGRNYERKLNSIEDIMRNNFKIGSSLALIRPFLNTPELQTYLKSHFVNCDTGTTCLNRSLSENMAVFKPRRKVSYIRHLFRDKNGFNLHYRIPKSITTLWLVAYFIKGHPIFPLMNRYLHYLIDHGFLAKITATYDHDITRKSTAHISKRKKFNFDYFVAPFFVLAIGNLLGVSVLIIEIFIDKIKKRQKLRFEKK